LGVFLKLFSSIFWFLKKASSVFLLNFIHSPSWQEAKEDISKYEKIFVRQSQHFKKEIHSCWKEN